MTIGRDFNFHGNNKLGNDANPHLTYRRTHAIGLTYSTLERKRRLSERKYIIARRDDGKYFLSLYTEQKKKVRNYSR